MIDFRPVANIIGRLTAAFGALMAAPMALDIVEGNPTWIAFAQAGAGSILLGAMVGLSTRGSGKSLTLEQAFLLTSGLWLFLPIIGALPFLLMAHPASVTDALFESMSGMTTTGATIFPRLAELSPGLHLWRGLLHWSGGLGIVVIAMLFLPVMKIGGMQFFRSEGFDTMGKVLPRAGEIASQITRLYIMLTLACTLAFIVAGMPPLIALIHALSTCSTGGFSTGDLSFGAWLGAPQMVASVFMVLACLPFVRMVQAARGEFLPIWKDSQVRTFLAILAILIGFITVYELVVMQVSQPLVVLREVTFNVITVVTGTGFASTDVTQWGHLPFALLILGALIGGCTGSTSCSIKVFRYQVLWRVIRAQLVQMQSPHRVSMPRLDGRRLDAGVINSVMVFFTLFVLTFGLLIVGLALTGLHPRTALTAAWTAIANVGPVWGPEVSRFGSLEQFPPAAKWLMIAGMYLGRLEILSVLVLLMPQFWKS
ncbi:MAG: potassium transporter TrkH [Paracoccus denitrificans]|nr:MAG: potassium transporter TrkH [Paracoccus denitrificans]PZO86386.1 MAG: potassium transporter TrkH [Paracoccus denitrificans]